MPRILEYFPEVAVALNEEIAKNHPTLARDLASRPGATLEEKMALVALYCNLGVDGWFNENDLKGLFELCYQRLRQKGTIILTSTPSTKQ